MLCRVLMFCVFRNGKLPLSAAVWYQSCTGQEELDMGGEDGIGGCGVSSLTAGLHIHQLIQRRAGRIAVDPTQPGHQLFGPPRQC